MQFIIYLFVLVSFSSLFTKMYYHNRFLNKDNRADLDIFFRRYYSIKYLFPIRSNANDPEKNRLLKNGNKALAIFYISFSIVLLLSFLGYIFTVSGDL